MEGEALRREVPVQGPEKQPDEDQPAQGEHTGHQIHLPGEQQVAIHVRDDHQNGKRLKPGHQYGPHADDGRRDSPQTAFVSAIAPDEENPDARQDQCALEIEANGLDGGVLDGEELQVKAEVVGDEKAGHDDEDV